MAKVISILGVLLLSVFAPLAAQDRAAATIEALAAEFRAKGAYEVDFEVAVGEYRTRGSYAVEGGRYHLILGDAEVYADTSVRYEIDNRRREVTINLVDTASRNILNNPVHAFDFLGSEYVPTLLSEHDGLTTLVLAPAAGNSAPVGSITLTLNTAELQPRSICYDFDGERIMVRIDRIGALRRTFKTFDRADYADYEWIDFR